jgi:hypothetical protein
MTGIETALIIGAVASTAATAVGGISAAASAKSQKINYEYNAKVNEQNAKIAKDQAAYNAEQVLAEARKMRSSQISGYSKSNVTLSGSALDVMDESSVQGELEALQIKYQADLTANAQDSNAKINRLNAATSGRQSKTLLTAGLLNAAGAAASGAYGVYTQRPSAQPKPKTYTSI